MDFYSGNRVGTGRGGSSWDLPIGVCPGVWWGLKINNTILNRGPGTVRVEFSSKLPPTIVLSDDAVPVGARNGKG